MQIVKVYGPYSRKEDKRKIVVLRLADGKLTTKSYARFLYEQKNGKISSDLVVDHIDEDQTRDEYDNFQLLTREENTRKSLAGKAEIREFVCPMCWTKFNKFMRDVRWNQHKRNKAGPFCSKSCAGRYGTNKQYSVGSSPSARTNN